MREFSQFDVLMMTLVRCSCMYILTEADIHRSRIAKVHHPQMAFAVSPVDIIVMARSSCSSLFDVKLSLRLNCICLSSPHICWL